MKELERCYSAPPDSLSDDIRPLITEDVRRLLAHWLGVEYAVRSAWDGHESEASKGDA